MKSLTLKEVDDDLIAEIRQVAGCHGITEEQAALKLLRKGAGIEKPAPTNGKIGNSLDEFFGTMSHEEATQIIEAIQELRVVDRSIWR